MKDFKKTGRATVKCAERDRLWASFLKVGKEWQSTQTKLRKSLKRKSVLDLDVNQLEDMKGRFEKAHKLFGQHIARHGCQRGNTLVSQKRKNRK
jgi:hypothetical protein